MTSNDKQQYITVELFNSKMDTLLTQIKLENEKLRSELHNEIQAVRDIAIVNSAKVDMLQHTFYWGFGIMALVISIVSIFVPHFLQERKEQKQEQTQQQFTTRNEVQDMIAQALGSRKATM